MDELHLFHLETRPNVRAKELTNNINMWVQDVVAVR